MSEFTREVEEPGNLQVVLEGLTAMLSLDPNNTSVRIKAFVSCLVDHLSEYYEEDLEAEGGGDLSILVQGIHKLYSEVMALDPDRRSYESTDFWYIVASIASDIEDIYADYNPGKSFKVELSGVTYIINDICDEESAVFVAKLRAIQSNFLYDVVSVEEITDIVTAMPTDEVLSPEARFLQLHINGLSLVLGGSQATTAIVALHTSYGVREALQAFDLELPSKTQSEHFVKLARQIQMLGYAYMHSPDNRSVLLNKDLMADWPTLDQLMTEIGVTVKKLFTTTFTPDKAFKVTLKNWSTAVLGIYDEWQAITLAQLEAIRNNCAYDYVESIEIPYGKAIEN